MSLGRLRTPEQRRLLEKNDTKTNKQKNKVKYLAPRSREPDTLALIRRHVAFSCVVVSLRWIAVLVIDFSRHSTIHCAAKHPPGLNSSTTVWRALHKINRDYYSWLYKEKRKQYESNTALHWEANQTYLHGVASAHVRFNAGRRYAWQNSSG